MESFSGNIEELFEDFSSLLDEAQADKLISVIGTKVVKGRDKVSNTAKVEASLEGSVSSTGAGGKVNLGGNAQESSENERDFSDILAKTFNLKKLLLSLKAILGHADLRHLYVFIDDFSELPQEAMEVVIDTLIAPLNNWSEEFIKFKIAAYPSRIYYGDIDKTKIDEFALDIFQLYGTGHVSTMESKATDFVRRLVVSRISGFCKCEPEEFFGFDEDENELWKLLFFASMGNPRTLGYILFFAYESTLLYQKKIGVQAIREAARRYYEDKLEPYFGMSKFLHESFSERSSVFSLKELLEKIVARAKELRQNKESQVMRDIKGQPPTSHFHVVHEFESIFSTLELNFFISKYFEMSDRDGRKVAVYCLNYGLCQKYSIEFGRPTGKREFRLYFVERLFDYSSLVRDHIKANQEIICDSCGASFEMEKLPSLMEYGMLCPKCRKGSCIVSNLSRKYENTLRSVDDNLLLRPTELGILKTLFSEKRPLHASDIAGELDCSYQLVGKRGRNLADSGLVKREKNEDNRREFSLTRHAEKTYFPTSTEDSLQLPRDAGGA